MAAKGIGIRNVMDDHVKRNNGNDRQADRQQTATKGARWTEDGNGKDFWKAAR